MVDFLRRGVLSNAPMNLYAYVWYQIWAAVASVFVGTFRAKWMYDRLPENEWVYAEFVWQLPPAHSLAPTYPTDLSGCPPLDAQNYQRVIGIFDAVVPLASPIMADGHLVWFDVWALRPPGIPDAIVLRFDLYYFPGPEFLRVDIGQVLSLPFILRAGVSTGGVSMLIYADWMLAEGGVDAETKAAVLEIRDGVRPWVYGGSLVPVPNDGHPGLLEIHRQVTGDESLGTYYEPTVRALLTDARWRCLRELIGRRVWVRVSVSGNRVGAGDSRLPYGNAEWVHNHFGQVRLSWKYPSDRVTRHSEWRWVRTRDSVEVFTLPWVEGESPVLAPEYRRFGGLDVSVEVLFGGGTACDNDE